MPLTMSLSKLLLSTLSGIGLSLIVLTGLGFTPATYAAGITVNTAEDEENNDGDCSLREAIKAASFDIAVDTCTPGSDADTIQFSLATPVTITLSLGQIVVKNEPLTINGPGVTISGGGVSKIFKVDSAVPVTLTGLTLSNGYATTDGGGVQSSGSLTLIDTVLVNNRSLAKGGAISVKGQLTVDNSSFTNNHANGEGGAIYVDNINTTITVAKGRFENNQSGFWGGALYTNGALTLTGTQFISNSATNWGGAVFAWQAVNMTNTTFETNHSQTAYGAILAFSNLLAKDSTFNANSAGQKIGAVGVAHHAWLEESSFTGNIAAGGQAGALDVGGSVWLTSTRFIDNQTATSGGGLYHTGPEVHLTNSLFARNQAVESGGAMFLAAVTTATLLHNTIVAPVSPVTAGIYITSTGSVSIVNTIFDGYPHGVEVADGTVFEDYNLLHQTAFAGALTSGGHSFFGAPLYADPVNNDYHHANGSWAINTGGATALAIDFEGDARPGGGHRDIGWDETSEATDIALAKTVEVSPAPGAPITFTLTISNAGGSMAGGIVITDVLPWMVEQVTVVSSGVQITDTGATTARVWQAAPLSPGQQGVITLTGVLTQRLPRGPFTNTARVVMAFPPPPELSLANNSQSVTVIVPNFAPLAVGDVFTTAEDTPTTLLPVANDIDGEPLTLAAVGAPVTGTVSFSGANRLVYTPKLNFNGTDVFTYAVGDDLLTSTGTITVVVTPVNDAPVITASVAVTMSEDGSPTPFNLILHATDVDADSLSWSVETAAQHGAAAVPPGPAGSVTVAYTPTANYTGADAFTVQVSDSKLTDTVTVSVTLEPVNDAPVAADDPIMVLNKKDSDDVILLSGSPSVTITVLENDSDVENSPLSITAVGLPDQGGAAAIAASRAWLIYTPTISFIGTELFTYTVTDGDLFDTATVSVTVLNGVNGGRNKTSLVELNDGPHGSLTLTIEIPAGVVGDDHFSLVYDQPVSVGDAPPPDFLPAGAPFSLLAYINGALLAHDDSFLQPLTVTIEYGNSDTAATGAGGGSLTLFEARGGGGWSNEGVKRVAWSQDNQRVTLTLDHAGDFGIFRRAPRYLPVVLKNFASAPDLVVESLAATANNVQVVIANRGTQPVVDEFWVDVYLNPGTPPTQVNQTWQQLGSQGLAWGITAAALPLEPGQALTLTVGGDYFVPGESNVVWPLAPDTPVYAQVDAVNLQTSYGGVLENHEITGGDYNNLYSTISTAGLATLDHVWTPGPSTVSGLPGR